MNAASTEIVVSLLDFRDVALASVVDLTRGICQKYPSCTSILFRAMDDAEKQAFLAELDAGPMSENDGLCTVTVTVSGQSHRDPALEGLLEISIGG